MDRNTHSLAGKSFPIYTGFLIVLSGWPGVQLLTNIHLWVGTNTHSKQINLRGENFKMSSSYY